MGSRNHPPPPLIDKKSLDGSCVRGSVKERTEVRNVCEVFTSGPDLSLMPLSQHLEVEIPAPSL